MNEWKNEVKWHTKIEYVDLDTGEVITKEQAIKSYVIINKKKKSDVYKNTGTIKWIYECKTSQQLKLFDT